MFSPFAEQFGSQHVKKVGRARLRVMRIHGRTIVRPEHEEGQRGKKALPELGFAAVAAMAPSRVPFYLERSAALLYYCRQNNMAA